MRLLGRGLGTAEASSACLLDECSISVVRKPTEVHSKQLPLK